MGKLRAVWAFAANAPKPAVGDGNPVATDFDMFLAQTIKKVAGEQGINRAVPIKVSHLTAGPGAVPATSVSIEVALYVRLLVCLYLGVRML